MTTGHKISYILLTVFIFLAVFIAIELLIVKFRGTAVPIPDIPREEQLLGSGDALTYAVLGDSTAVSQGGDYQEGIAMSTARHLAKNYKVSMFNFAQSGARAGDVNRSQAPKAAEIKPDIALIAVGANDVTHLTSQRKVRVELNEVIDKLVSSNCEVKIILTGSPAMGTIPRFPQPLRALAGLRTKQVNSVIKNVASSRDLTFAPVAQETGEIFSTNPDLFAPDLFHPNSAGYATWLPVLHRALDTAKSKQPTHCDWRS